ncbi:MAG: bifunctional phosphopantothenoylcysteine decarboxylase/phosphopantothenate--cysteine ligase CoaBC [Actinomycetota bacterium]|nr:bifunctional phosphopantothenoylcysteine decarboxylase/phosphopantothenate--cysteine ligase CoaBC [Actinomycetota bacterium]
MPRVALGVSGGIAAYKACELTRLLVRRGYDVIPLLTPGAERFITAETFRALARAGGRGLYPHLERADLLVIAPATANTIAKLAHGLADNLVVEAALAHAGPILVAPAMNVRMWEHPATQANVRLLRERGVELVGPVTGELAEGEWGIGRMADPATIFARCETLLEPRSGVLHGRRVVVSAGGTREPLDSVRFLANRSSGRMGVALAEEARRRGADVTLLAANLAVPAPAGVDVVETPSAADVEREALARDDADVLIMAAAVADYRPATALAHKRPSDSQPWNVELRPTPDILRALGERHRNGQVVVGFAAEDSPDGLARARDKLERKKADLIVYNDVGRQDAGFDVADNEVVLVTASGERAVPRAPKAEVAAAVLDEVTRLLEERDGRRIA